MLQAFGQTQKSLLAALLDRKAGYTADELVEKFGITRSAIRQHMSALKSLGYIEEGLVKETGGRPAIIYKLSKAGNELFPRQYSWFSSLLIQRLLEQHGQDGLSDQMEKMAETIAQDIRPRLAGKSGKDRLVAIAGIMNELGYQARPEADGIEAKNCVYHELAARFPEVCRFDIGLLRTLTGAEVDHTSCMVRGGESCCFQFHTKK